MKLAEATLQLTAGDANKANALVAGTLNVATLGGMKDYRQALGQLLQTQSESRAVGLQDFVNNIGPGIAAATAQGMHQNGVSTERALEISAVIGQIIKDPTGANTATTMRQLFTRMDSFAPELQKKLDDGGTASVDQATIDKFMATRDYDARLQMMRENQGLALQFLETQRESIGKTAVREILIQSDRVKEFEDKAEEDYGSRWRA